MPNAGFFAAAELAPLAYPAAIARTFLQMGVNQHDVVPMSAAIQYDLFVNGAAVAGWQILFTSGQSGVKHVSPAPAPLAIAQDDRFDIRMSSSGLTGDSPTMRASATIAVS
jgi:hypothetical protein